MTSHAAPKRAPLFLAGLATLGLLAAACGGSSTGSPSSGDATGGGSTTTSTGEYADEAVLQAAVAKLAELESFSYETSVGMRHLGEDYLVNIAGVERPADDARSLYATRNDGVEWAAMTVDGAFYADIGRGLEPLDPREDGQAETDPNYIANLLEGALGTRWDDFTLVAEESISGRPVRHFALDEGAVEKLLQSYDGDFETFSADLWIDSSDGYLVRANFGRRPFPTSGFTPLTEFRFELSDVGCACPITKPI